MKRIKAYKPITRKLNKFLKPFGCQAKLSTDFSYWYATSTINYALLAIDNDLNDFLSSVYRFEPRIKTDGFIWCILHELGHHETMDLLDEDDLCLSANIKSACEGSNPSRPKIDYYLSPDELMATEWAVEYANTHSGEIRQLYRELAPLIQRFYKKNKVKL